MGIDYNPMLYVGKQFDDETEAIAFLDSHHFLNDEDKEQVEYSGLSDFLAKDKLLQGDFIDAMSGYGYVLGYDLSKCVFEPETYLAVYKESVREWYELFDDVKPDIIHEVHTW